MGRFLPHARFKAAYGGRGSGKSWAFARMAILRAWHKPIRVLCAREFQVSISDSVHHLLAAQIDALGLQGGFEVGESFIRAKNGSEFIFRGIRRNPTGLKSMEDVKICWVEEAQDISEASWKMLTPTIRAPGSEIWVTFNPNEATDPTYRRFVGDPMPGVVSRKVNWSDNPHFPPELEQERAWMAKTDPDAYSHVWEGNCIQASDAQVLRGKITIEPFEPKQGWDGPYYGADWGFAQDPTTLVKVWVGERRLWVEHEAYGVGVEIDHTPAMFDRVPGSRQHLIRADSARPETISYMGRNGFKMAPAPKWEGSVKDGVVHLRGYEQIVLHPRCKHAAEEARLWKYKTDRLTGDVLPELHPGHEHIWDAVRYALAPLIQRRDPQSSALRVSSL